MDGHPAALGPSGPRHAVAVPAKLCRVRRRKTLTLAVVATAVTTAPLAFAASTPDYKKLIVKAGKKSIAATLGTHCVPTGNGKGDCADATYPLKTTGKLSVRAGETITLLFGAPVGDVRWRAARISGGKEYLNHAGVAKLATKTKKRWRITLPKNLKKSSKVIGIDAQSPNAYASFEVGITVR
jgi:hypothetical protein